MGKLLSILFLIIFGTFFGALGQTVTLGAVDAGPYGNGSSIAVALKIEDTEGKLKTDNVFKLYLSDASGNFAQPKEIGTYKGFYTTFINGIIPTGLPAGDYKLMVTYADEQLNSQASNTIKIVGNAGVTAEIDANASQTISNNPKTFGICQPERSSIFRFSNVSTPGAKVSVAVTNEETGDQQNYDFAGLPISVTAEMTHYTMFAKAELNGVIGTKAFFLINNIIKPGFSAPANSTVCLPAELTYDIETKSENGIQNNFPGYSYQVNWGDGHIEDITPNKIISSKAQISHTYVTSSCGKQIKINDVNYYNVYGIIYQVNSPYCGLVSVPISTQSKVVTPPENRFSLPASACLNTELILANRSLAGDNPSSNSPNCTNGNNVYYWFVDDVPVTPQGVSITYNLKHVFTTPGFHNIRLESQSFSSCEAKPVEKRVYVQGATIPNFKLSEQLACVGAVIKASDLSVKDASEFAQNIYEWKVIGPNATEFINGTTSASENPEFKFDKPGVYTVILIITSPCNPSAIEKTVVINDAPTITADWQTVLCGKGQLITFDESLGNPMKTAFTGTSKTENDSYRWEISGGAFTFKSSTNENSKSPSVLFQDNGTYTITITHQNNCGASTVTKTITINDAPTVFAGADQTVCANTEVALDGSVISDAEETYTWFGGEGLFTPSRNVLNPVYLPSVNEKIAGLVQLKLSVSTSSVAPCNLIEDLVLIKIKPENKITSAPNKSICTGLSVDYTPLASVNGSTFNWVATKIVNAANYTTNGNGRITDVLKALNTNEEAIVTYLITPNNGGCDGVPFEFTVTVKPIVKVVAVSNEETVCSSKKITITLASNLADTRYTWTSTATEKISGNSQNSTPKAITEISDLLTNAGDSTGFVTYTILPENINGCTGDAVIITINVSASAGIVTFSPDKTTGCSPLKIAFKNTTKGSTNKYYWTFGDGQTLTTTDNNTVNHTYLTTVTKTFIAKLVTVTDCGSFNSEFSIRITPNTVEPELVVNSNEYEGCAPHTVTFFNNSKGGVFYKYDFDDGTITEGNQSPQTITHTFTQAGTYVVKLTASNGCSDTTTTETIKVFPQSFTDFSADVTSSCDSVTVKFTNKSENAVAYLWEFGDGDVSTDSNPVHTFKDDKQSYTVSLMSFSSFGCPDTMRKVDLIKVGATPRPVFVVSPGLTIQYPNYRFTFKNETKGEIESYTWDFGDGQTATTFDAEHSYPDTGVYKVKLTARNETGCVNTVFKTVRILGTPGNLFIPNAFMPNSLVDEIRVFQAKGSGMATWHFRIFNKWGQLIWQTTKLDENGRPTEGWDGMMFGNKAAQGVYFWEVGAKFINGTEWAGMPSTEGAEPKKAGTLNLIR